MIERLADMWLIDADVFCVLTNGTVLPNGRNIMGGGVALEAKRRFKDLDLIYGYMIESHGNHCFVIVDMVMFPTKERIEENSTIERINHSLAELEALADIYLWRKIVLPRPGCGLGGLKWEEVRPHLEHLDNRFIITHKEQ